MKTMSDSKKFENSEEQNSIAYNVDAFTKVNTIVQSSTVDRQNCTATSFSEPSRKNTDFLQVSATHNESNIMNTIEEQCIDIHCAETCHAEKETNLIQDTMVTGGKTKDEMKILTNENNMIVTQVSESSVDDDNVETVIKDDTSISTDDNNMTVKHVQADSETDKNTCLETKFCDKTEGEKGNELLPANVDEWCKHLDLLCLTQLLIRVFMEAFRNLIVIKIDLQKVVFNYCQKLKDKTSCFISEKIHQVIKGAKLVGSIVTFAVREYITCYDESIIRLILNDEENKKVYLVREYFRLATFGYYSRSDISQPVVLKLAGEGYFCDPDGTIRCFKCYRELPLSAIHTFDTLHIRCRFSYMHENMSIANSYGNHAPDWILDVNQQNQNDSDIRDLQSFDDVVLNRPRFTQQERRQPLHFQENVFLLEMERRRRMSYSGRMIDLRAFRERSHARQDSHSLTGTISIQPRGSVSPADDPMNQMLDDFERITTNDLLNSHTDSSITSHMNTAVTSACFGNNQGQQLPAIAREKEEQVISNISENIQSSDLLTNQPDEHTPQQIPNEPAPPVVVDSLLSDETLVKQIYESVRSRNPSDTIVTDIQSTNQEQPANRINSTHQTSPLTDGSCKVQEESESPIAASFRGSNTKTIVQSEQLHKPECKDSIIPAPDIPTLSMNSEHGEDDQPEYVDLALQTSPDPKQTSPMTYCNKSVSVQGPHTGNSLQPTVFGSFKNIRKRHSSQPTSDESKTEVRRNMLPRKVIRTRHYSEPTDSENKPRSTVAQAFYESLEDSFTPRSEQRKFSLPSDQEKKTFSHLDHPDDSASAKVPNTASCVESLVQASLQIEETDVSETEQNQGAMAAAQSKTDINSGDGAARAINEHQKRRRRKTV